MPSLSPFRGLRYDPAVVRLDDVIAPPYDVIGPAERSRLASRHPANSVLVEVPEADLSSGRDRYQVAADLLAQWRASGLVRRDLEPALYPYAMTTPSGHRTIGVLGALGLPDAGGGAPPDVLPHEETLPKPKSDRLDLLRATKTNLSPIWGLSLSRGLTETFAPDGPAAARAVDDDGVLHELWVLRDPAAIGAIREAVGGSPVVIADGHHRYETARTYQREVRDSNGGRHGDHDAVMALVVELAEDQLHVRAIHRMVHGLPAGVDLLSLLDRYFEASRAGDPGEGVAGALERDGTLALVTSEGTWALTVRPGAFDEAATDLEAGLVDLALRDVPGVSVSYSAQWREAVDAIGTHAQAAIILRPVSVGQISSWAGARRKMPPKTTYFSPKPRTGMVFRMLEDPTT